MTRQGGAKGSHVSHRLSLDYDAQGWGFMVDKWMVHQVNWIPILHPTIIKYFINLINRSQQNQTLMGANLFGLLCFILFLLFLLILRFLRQF